MVSTRFRASAGVVSVVPARASEQLRRATEDRHALVERNSNWNAFFATRESYAAMLRALAAVIEPADQAIESQLSLPHAWFVGRRTASAIEQDLRVLAAPMGADVAAAPLDFSWVDSAASAAGVLYVLEGSALGSVHLSALAARRLGIGPACGGSYLAAYGRRTTDQWRFVRDWLDESLSSPALLDTAIDAALRTFGAFQTTLGGGR